MITHTLSKHVSSFLTVQSKHFTYGCMKVVHNAIVSSCMKWCRPKIYMYLNESTVLFCKCGCSKIACLLTDEVKRVYHPYIITLISCLQPNSLWHRHFSLSGLTKLHVTLKVTIFAVCLE